MAAPADVDKRPDAVTTTSEENCNTLHYRAICVDDKDELKALHEEFFPVRYNDGFYDDAVRGKGINGGPLIAIVVTEGAHVTQDSSGAEVISARGRMVGFVLAQMLRYNGSACEDTCLFAGEQMPSREEEEGDGSLSVAGGLSELYAFASSIATSFVEVQEGITELLYGLTTSAVDDTANIPSSSRGASSAATLRDSDERGPAHVEDNGRSTTAAVQPVILPQYVCYVLTIGVASHLRGRGVGGRLMQLVWKQASTCGLARPPTDPHAAPSSSSGQSEPSGGSSAALSTCGAMYLHVIEHNTAAMRFYRREGLRELRSLPSFYTIDGRDYAAKLYVRYVDGYLPYEAPQEHSQHGVGAEGNASSVLLEEGRAGAGADISPGAGRTGTVGSSQDVPELYILSLITSVLDLTWLWGPDLTTVTPTTNVVAATGTADVEITPASGDEQVNSV